jgi:hypothetical protein
MMPTSTVRTNETAPHSRRKTAQFTSAKFYRRPGTDVVRRLPAVDSPD